MRKRQGVSIALPAAVAVMAAMAIGVEIWTRRIEARHPAKGRIIRVDGVDLHYVERGSGPAILLLHGNGAMVEDMMLSGIMARLSRNHRVIAIDRPGFGHSSRPKDRTWTAAAQAELLWAALDQLGVERAIVAGQSWGALAAMAMGLARPERTTALVLASGYYYPLERFKIRLCALSALPVLGTLMRHTVAPITSALLSPMIIRKIFAPAPVPEHFREFPISLSWRPRQLRATAEDCAVMIKDTRRMQERYGELHMPVAILCDREDAIIDQEQQSIRLHREIPGSRLYDLHEAGHMLHHVLPEQLVRAVRELPAASEPPARPPKMPPERPAAEPVSPYPAEVMS